MTRTVVELLEAAARAHGDRPAMRRKEGGAWRVTTWSEYRDQALRAARGFMALGLEPRQGAVLMGFNRPEWFLADVGAIAAGGVPAGIYTTSTAEQCQYIAAHAGAAVAVVENEGYLRLFEAVRDRLPALRAIVLMAGEARGEGVHTWQELLALADRVPEADLERRIRVQRPGDLCTLIYTSGTTGTPKAVMLSHHNLVWTAERIVEAFEVEPESDLISYLPLSHIAEQLLSLYCALAAGGCSWFAESLEKMPENLREIRPTFFFGVPRVWEKMQAAIAAAAAVTAQASPLKRRIAAWARGVGLEAGYAEQRGGRRPFLHPLARRLVFAKVRERLGLDRARICSTSAAPIALETLEFFLGLGIPLYEVYGMSECTGPTTLSLPGRYRTGRAGFAIPGTGLRIAEDGEILMRGPHVFLGYLKDEAATREALDGEGWLHSGDIGELDADGFLRVTDRKKELLITAGGKNIGPQLLESLLKRIPAVSQAVVIGDRRPYLAALLALDPSRAPLEAEAAGSPARAPRDLAACPVFRQHLERQVEEVNAGLARFETIKRFAILAEELSIEGGELTPTMKLKRRMIQQKYAEEIEALYA